MGRMTIDYGIDLGTTNSEIAVLRGTQPEVIHKADGAVMTPSAVFIDKKGDLHVGLRAKNQYERDPDNCEIEFKLKMGHGAKGRKVFKSSGRSMLPEEMSAEVLKELRADVFQMCHEDIRSAVITVPADFDRPEIEATHKAGTLAGFSAVQLLQEPVAAALAYGFQDESDKVFWLVYDFGGGTFDAAVMQVRDGMIQVVNHAGDNLLGGKLIDWDIVNKKLIPGLTSKYALTDFRRGTPKWRAAIAQLKNLAEEAKVQVSRTGQTKRIWWEDLCVDEGGRAVELDLTLTLEELEKIAAPYVVRSINLCRKALSDKGLVPKDVQKVLMVGGTSCLPSLRDQLEKELGIPLEFAHDPMLVVAEGAAIFAGTQKCVDVDAQVPAGAFTVDLQYEPIGSDTEAPVAGKITAPQSASLEGYTLELVEAQSRWRSGKIRLGAGGAFMTEVHAERGRKCEYVIVLCNPSGTAVTIVPNRFGYTPGMVIDGMPLQHSIGVAMANNEADWFLLKGDPQPAHKTLLHNTVREIRRERDGDGLTIPVVEGKNKRGDRNRQIGRLFVPSNEMRRDLPAGSDVEITIDVDRSGVLTAKAFVPVLDQWFDKINLLEDELSDPAVLNEDLERQCKRLEEVRSKVDRTQDLKAQEAIARIENEQIVEQVEPLLQAAENGEGDALKPCAHRILDLADAIDQVEDALAWPVLVEEAETALRDTQNTVSEHGEPAEKAAFRALETETRKAVDSGQADLLRQWVDEVKSLYFQVVLRKAEFWVNYLDYLEVQRPHMCDSAQAAMLFTQGRKAINNNDLEALKAAVHQLIGLLPRGVQEQARGFGGSTIRLR